MKKLRFLSIVLIICMLVLVGCGTNNKAYDSANIENEVLDSVGVNKAIRVYECSIYNFCRVDDFNEILNSAEKVFYYLNGNSHFEKAYIREEKIVTTDISENIEDVYRYTLSYESLFEVSKLIEDSKSIQVNAVYCFEFKSSPYHNDNDFAVFYNTNQGDYVYYKPRNPYVLKEDLSKGDLDYFMPADKFCEFVEVEYNAVKDAHLLGGRNPLWKYNDMSMYEIELQNSDLLHLFWIIPIALIGVAVIIITVVIEKKKKRLCQADGEATEQSTADTLNNTPPSTEE